MQIKVLTLSIFAFLIFSIQSNAENQEQDEPSSFFIAGGGIDYFSFPDENLFSIDPALGFFIDKNLMIGLETSMSSLSPDGDQAFTTEISLYSIGPHLRYYLYSTENNRIRLFSEGRLGVQFGNETFDTPSSKTEESIGPNLNITVFQPGVTFQMAEWVAFDLSVNAGLYYQMTDLGDKTHNIGIGSNTNPILDLAGIPLERNLLNGRIYFYF